MTALAFLAGLLVGVCGLLAVSLCMVSSRVSRLEERWRPMDDRAPGKQGR
jgi:hypothetical protein